MPIELEGETQATTSPPEPVEAPALVPVLTILSHPDSSRVGERVYLRALNVGREVLLSRVEPLFASPSPGGAGRDESPLGGRYLSRQPIRLRPAEGAGSLVLDLSTTRTRVEVDGEAVAGQAVFSSQAIEAGVVLNLARKIVLLLHRTTRPVTHDAKLPAFGLVGDGKAMFRLRQEIRRLAPLDVSVMLRGESGTGKELVAQALHRGSHRQSGPFVAVNMGSLTPSLAAASLFGVERGAYTGADRNRHGHFRSAQGGTLFLDEIGEAPPEVQVALLRTLETGEIQPVGSTDTFKVDVRVVAATDTKLEEAMEAGRFRTPLYHRLAGYTVYLPPLRERREDLGQLLYHFLRQELAEMGESLAEDSDPNRPWPEADWVARLAVHRWPGNVRELRNATRRLAIAGRHETPDLEQLLGNLDTPSAESSSVTPEPVGPAPTAVSPPTGPKPRRTLRKLEDVSESELLQALRDNRWHVQATAEALQVSRPNLYRLMEACPAVRTANELERQEIEDAVASAEGDLEDAAVELNVSLHGLKRRMRALGLSLG